MTPHEYDALAAGIYFKDRVDENDGNYRLVDLRLPHDRASQPTYGPFEYEGDFAHQRLRRFCAAFLSATGDITERDAAKIRKSASSATDRLEAAARK